MLIYQRDGIQLMRGDCREVLPTLDLDWSRVVLITDPVWPKPMKSLQGAEDPWGLWLEMWESLPEPPKRAAIQLPVIADPRFLGCVPLEFYRSINLEYPQPSFVGRNVWSCEQVFLFGEAPPIAQSSRMFPGRIMSKPGRRKTLHPCPRSLEHVRGIVGLWSEPDDIILDPFCGSGTTLLTARYWGREAIGIEFISEFAEEAAQLLLASEHAIK